MVSFCFCSAAGQQTSGTQSFNKRAISISPGSYTVETGSAARRSVASPLSVSSVQEGQDDGVRRSIASPLSFPSFQCSDDSDAASASSLSSPTGQGGADTWTRSPRASFLVFPPSFASGQRTAERLHAFPVDCPRVEAGWCCMSHPDSTSGRPRASGVESLPSTTLPHPGYAGGPRWYGSSKPG